MSDHYRRLLLLPHLQIHNANALSSPFTIGFPAMTAWLGAVHALQRKLNRSDYPKLRFGGMAVACHTCNLCTYQGTGDYVSSIIGTANPLDKSGNRPAFIEEARCHLEITLVIEITGMERDEEEGLQTLISRTLPTGKVAGGDILQCDSPEFRLLETGNEQEWSSLTRKLMPGHLIIERRDLMTEAMVDGEDALDALLGYLTVKHRSEQDEGGTITWTRRRKTTGWIVPIATGFQGLTTLGQAEHQRDTATPHRFAESVVTLGEFVMPHRVRSLDDMLWHYCVEPTNNLYLCQQLPSD